MTTLRNNVQLGLFNRPSPETMSRATDPDTSHEAAARVLPSCTALQGQIMEKLRMFPKTGLTAGELEAMQDFKGLAPSTVRKRVSELYHAGNLRIMGRRDGMNVWGMV